MAAPTDSIQDFFTFADITERLRELKEVMQTAIARLPDDENRQMLIACLCKQIVGLPAAPTRWAMSKEMAEMEKVRTKLEGTAEQLQATINQLAARKEVESIEQENS
jgi:hypothetical protein